MNNSRFVVKIRGGSNVLLMYFWLNQWVGVNGNLEGRKAPKGAPRQIEQCRKWGSTYDSFKVIIYTICLQTVSFDWDCIDISSCGKNCESRWCWPSMCVGPARPQRSIWYYRSWYFVWCVGQEIWSSGMVRWIGFVHTSREEHRRSARIVIDHLAARCSSVFLRDRWLDQSVFHLLYGGCSRCHNGMEHLHPHNMLMTISFLHVRPDGWSSTPAGMTSKGVFWVFRRGAWRVRLQLNPECKTELQFGLDPGLSFKSSMLRQIPVSILEELKWNPLSVFEISASSILSNLAWACESRYSQVVSTCFFHLRWTSSASCTLHVIRRAAPATGFSDVFFLGWIIATSFSLVIASIFSGSTAAWHQCCGEVWWPIYVLVTQCDGNYYVIYIGFWSELESHTNCAPWCIRLCTVLRRFTSETCWPRWLNCLVARTFVLLRLDYTTCHAHEQNLVTRAFSVAGPTAWNDSATRAACNRWLCVFPEKT